MHELPITQGILDLVLDHAARAGAARVTAVHLVIGGLSGVVDDAVRFCWGLLSEGTPAQGARFILVEKPGRAWCTACSRDVDVADRLAVCPQCGSGQLLLKGGEELRVLELEVD